METKDFFQMSEHGIVATSIAFKSLELHISAMHRAGLDTFAVKSLRYEKLLQKFKEMSEHGIVLHLVGIKKCCLL